MKYKREENYCSFSPDELFGVRFNFGCYLHDRQYRNEVKNRLTRKQADRLLMRRIEKSFKIKNKQFIGFIVSRIYYLAVRLIGWQYWEK